MHMSRTSTSDDVARQDRRKAKSHKVNQVKADPGEFEKKTSAVRERMARDIKETSPEERLRAGR
jgi:hypothetical protein